MNKKIRFAIIGCGNIGKQHANIVGQHPEAELAALVDIAPYETLNLSCYKAPFFNSLDALLQSNITFDIACITTPNGLHHVQSVACLQQGKHVIIEKPMALTKLQAEEILQVARSNGKSVFTVLQNRYSPPSIWLKEIVDSGKLGKIFNVHVNCFWNRDRRYYKEPGKEWRGTKDLDGGCLFTQFSHFIDILYWLFGNIREIHAITHNYNHQSMTAFADSGIVNFLFEKEGMGSLNFSTCCWESNLESSITIIAENGSVKVGGQYMNEISLCHIKDYTLPAIGSHEQYNHYGDYTGSAANHHFVFKNVIDYLKGRSYSLPNPQDSVAVIGMIEDIYRAANDYTCKNQSISKL